MFAIVSNNLVTTYPAYPDRDNPNISCPENWGGGTIGNTTYCKVIAGTIPSANMGWSVSETTPTYDSNTNLVTQQYTTTFTLDTDMYLNYISNQRFAAETSGVPIANVLGDGVSYTFPSDRPSQSKYAAITLTLMQPTTNLTSFSVNWKIVSRTFITLNANQMMSVVLKIRDHVQSAFDKEMYYVNIINTGNVTLIQSTDFTADW